MKHRKFMKSILKIGKNKFIYHIYDSVDFGKYDSKTAKKAFEKHNVYYDNKNVFNEFCLNKIDCI